MQPLILFILCFIDVISLLPGVPLLLRARPRPAHFAENDQCAKKNHQLGASIAGRLTLRYTIALSGIDRIRHKEALWTIQKLHFTNAMRILSGHCKQKRFNESSIANGSHLIYKQSIIICF